MAVLFYFNSNSSSCLSNKSRASLSLLFRPKVLNPTGSALVGVGTDIDGGVGAGAGIEAVPSFAFQWVHLSQYCSVFAEDSCSPSNHLGDPLCFFRGDL